MLIKVAALFVVICASAAQTTTSGERFGTAMNVVSGILGLVSSVQNIRGTTAAAQENLELRAELDFDWTGWSEYSAFCPGGLCPAATECRVARYTSSSGQKCRCVAGTEIQTMSNGEVVCTDYAGMVRSIYFCKKNSCPLFSYCVNSLMLDDRFCGCKSGYNWEYKPLTERYTCKKI